MQVREGTYEWAHALIRQGEKLRRRGWGDRDKFHRKWIALIPENGSTLSYLAICYPEGHYREPHGCIAPWTPTRCDLLTDDWERL